MIVYPMNALINSQTEELGKYFNNYREQFGKEPPFTFGQYTGQEKQEVRKRLQESPPNILLTNYMMLELLLTRSKERPLRNALYKNLQFIVFDELHTYRGRQGADVGMLIEGFSKSSPRANLYRNFGHNGLWQFLAGSTAKSCCRGRYADLWSAILLLMRSFAKHYNCHSPTNQYRISVG